MNMIHTLPDLHETGLDPRLWGSAAWKFMDALVIAYPADSSTPTIREVYRRFFEDLRHLLPCPECRQNHQSFLAARPLTDSDLMDRGHLLMFYADLKNSVSHGSDSRRIVADDTMVQAMLRNLWGDADPIPPPSATPPLRPQAVAVPRPPISSTPMHTRMTASSRQPTMPSTPVPQRMMTTGKRGCGCGGYHRRR